MGDSTENSQPRECADVVTAALSSERGVLWLFLEPHHDRLSCIAPNPQHPRAVVEDTYAAMADRRHLPTPRGTQAQRCACAARLPARAPEQRQRVRDCIVASFTAQNALDKTMSALQDIETFARPLLVNALKDQFGVTLAPRIETWLSLRKSLQVTHFNVDTLAYDFLKLELLQAALHNFEEAECEQGAFHPSSGFKWQVPTRGVSPQHSLLPLRMRGLEVHQFMTMCRTLDLGGKYRSYISKFFNPSDAAVETTLRQQFIASQKTAMRAAAELALVGEDITQDDYNMLLSVIDGERSPRSGGQPVWICDLGLMKLRMTGCVLFLAFDHARAHFPILYIPTTPIPR